MVGAKCVLVHENFVLLSLEPAETFPTQGS